MISQKEDSVPGEGQSSASRSSILALCSQLGAQHPALLAIFAQFEMSGAGPLCAAAEHERDEALLALAETWKRGADADGLTTSFLVRYADTFIWLAVLCMS